MRVLRSDVSDIENDLREVVAALPVFDFELRQMKHTMFGRYCVAIPVRSNELRMLNEQLYRKSASSSLVMPRD